MTWFRLSLEHVRSMCIVLSCQSVMFMKRFNWTFLHRCVTMLRLATGKEIYADALKCVTLCIRICSSADKIIVIL